MANRQEKRQKAREAKKAEKKIKKAVSKIVGPRAPMIKIAPTLEQKEIIKAQNDRINVLAAVELDENGREIPYRNEDIFFNGPWNNQYIKHSPNGPTFDGDSARNWADYYIYDKFSDMENGQKVWYRGYHIYSTVRGFLGDNYASHGGKFSNSATMGTRGPNFRKCYYWCGFYDVDILPLMGVDPGEFTYHLSA